MNDHLLHGESSEIIPFGLAHKFFTYSIEQMFFLVNR